MSQPEVPPRVPSFGYSAPEALEVWAFVPGYYPTESLSPDGKYETLGSTRGWFGRRRSVSIPEHLTWGVSGGPLDALLSAAKRDTIPGLDLSHVQVGDAELARVAELSWLVDLTLPTWNAITDKGLEHLSRLGKLRSLGLGQSFGITEAGLDHVAKLRGLFYLDLSFEKTEDRPIGTVAPEVPITNKSLEKLVPLSRLRCLELRGAWVTGEGLKILERFPALRGLSLYDIDAGESPTTDAEREAFQKALPECTVIEW